MGETAAAVAAICICNRKFYGDGEQTAWKSLQQHVEEFAGIDDDLHGLKEFTDARRTGLTPLTPDEIIATHAADIERQWRLGLTDDPNVEPYEDWARHVTEYLSLIVHKQHPEDDWQTCTNPACIWARSVVTHER